MKPQRNWTQEEIADVLEMRRTQTTKVIAKKYGVTRNSITGLVRRNSYRKPTVRKPIARRVTAIKAKKNHITHAAIKRDNKYLMDLKNDDCRYPIGNKYCCNNTVAKGQPYCEGHYNLCHRANWKDK